MEKNLKLDYNSDCYDKNKFNILMELLNIESNSVLRVQSISTITIYDGICSNEYIIQKINKIINLNPWLNGNLIKIKEKIYLNYNTRNYNYNIKNIYNYIEDDSEIYDSFINNKNINNYDCLIKHIENMLVKPGIKCLNNDEKLFKVILTKINTNKFALIISINHCIADGYTYYKIYHMFSNMILEEKLIINRMYEFDNIISQNKNNWQSYIGRKILFFINELIKKKPIELYTIDKQNINNIKKYYNNKNIYISTNDIITSEFFNKSNTLIGLMSFNYRNVNINKYKSLAGNYIDMIYFKKKIFTPCHIRFNLNLFRLNANMDIKKKTIFNHICNYLSSIYNNIFNTRNIFSLSCISSWISLYKELKINNSNKIIHIPCITKLNSLIYFNNFCLVFHYTDKEIGILSNVSNLQFIKNE